MVLPLSVSGYGSLPRVASFAVVRLRASGVFTRLGLQGSLRTPELFLLAAGLVPLLSQGNTFRVSAACVFNVHGGLCVARDTFSRCLPHVSLPRCFA